MIAAACAGRDNTRLIAGRAAEWPASSHPTLCRYPVCFRRSE